MTTELTTHKAANPAATRHPIANKNLRAIQANRLFYCDPEFIKNALEGRDQSWELDSIFFDIKKKPSPGKYVICADLSRLTKLNKINGKTINEFDKQERLFELRPSKHLDEKYYTFGVVEFTYPKHSFVRVTGPCLEMCAFVEDRNYMMGQKLKKLVSLSGLLYEMF